MIQSYLRPRTLKDSKNQNIVAQFSRNNLHCFKVELGKTDVYKNSFFPRIVRDWNNLDESTASAESTEEFKDLLSTHD